MDGCWFGAVGGNLFTRAMELIRAALPAVRTRKARFVTSAFVMFSGLSYSK